MPAYPTSLPARFASDLARLFRRVRQLEARTAAIDSGWPLAALPGIINPAYTSGDPTVLVNGSATLTGPYNHLSSYTPAASDQVLLLPIPLTAQGGAVTNYVILGKVV